jgi:hypothetical protein
MAGSLKIILNSCLVICWKYEQILSSEELHSMYSGRLSVMIISYQPCRRNFHKPVFYKRNGKIMLCGPHFIIFVAHFASSCLPPVRTRVL